MSRCQDPETIGKGLVRIADRLSTQARRLGVDDESDGIDEGPARTVTTLIIDDAFDELKEVATELAEQLYYLGCAREEKRADEQGERKTPHAKKSKAKGRKNKAKR